MTKIPVDSIAIPERFLTLCCDWYGNINCKLYAIASTGAFHLGNRRPPDCDSDEKWYVAIWRDLSHAVYLSRRGAGDEQCFPGGHKDHEALCKFEGWVDQQLARLEESYGLEEWKQE